MWHLLHLIARTVAALLGLFCFLTAIFLYPGEEGKIQSRLEDFWIRSFDFQYTALSRHTAFLQRVANFESLVFDKVFGSDLNSSKALSVSFCGSIASLSLAELTLLFYQRVSLTKGLVLLTLGSLVAASGSSILSKDNTIRNYLVAILGGFAALIWSDTQSLGYLNEPRVRTVMIALMSIGALCDIAFINVTRRLIRWAGKMDGILKVISVIALNLLMAAFLLGPGLLIARTTFSAKKDLYLECVAIVSLSNVFDALIALLFVILPLTLLIHRLLWPLLSRTLFAMQDIGIKGRRAILTAIGVALLGSSVFGWKFPELLKEMVEAFGG